MRLLLIIMLFSFTSLAYSQNYTLKKYEDDPLRTWHYTLDNGLQVFLTENHEKPVFYSEIVVRAGSSSDPATATGIAHYLEHMLFKGTDRYGTVDYKKEKVHLDRITELYEKHRNTTNKEERAKIMSQISEESDKASKYAIPNEFDRMYQRLGGTAINAHTSQEETVYKVQCPSNTLKKWCLIEAERFRNPVFRLFQTEIEAVYEEKNGSLDSKSSALYEAFLAKMFKKHPYGQQTTLGSVEHLKSPSIKEMYKFYNKYYVASNMAIVISGDINPEEAIKDIARSFSILPKGEKIVRDLPKEDSLKGVETVSVDFPGEEQLMIGFRLPVEGGPDEHALKFVDMILDNSQAGLINVNLNQPLKVKRAGSYPYLLNEYGMHIFYGLPKKGQKLEEVQKLILEQIEKVKKGEFEEWLLPAILADFKKSKQSSFETNSSRVAAIRDLFLAGQPISKFTDDMKAFAKVTKEDVVRVANKYYKSDYVVAYRRDKEIDKIKMTKPKFNKVEVEAGRESLLSKRVGYTPVAKMEPIFVDFKKDFQIKEIAKGLSLYYCENPINGLFDLQIVIPIGKRHEPELPLLASLIDSSGWEGLSPEQVSNSFYRKAASFGMSVGNNETVLILSGIDDSFEDTVNLFFNHLNNFVISDERIKAQADVIVDSRVKQKKEPAYLSSALSYFSRYGNKSPFLTDLSSKELTSIDFKTLKKLMGKLLNSEMKINYTGRNYISDASRVLTKFASEAVKAPEEILLNASSTDKPKVNFLHFKSVQTYVRMEFSGDLYDVKDEYMYTLFNEYFDGSLGSVVFQEIREKRALAYSAWSRFFPVRYPSVNNLMICSLTTQADKTIDALEVFHDIVYNFPLEQKRFEIAKGALLKQLKTKRLNFRERLSTIQEWERLGLKDIDPNKMFIEQIQKATLKDLEKFVKDKISNKKFTISIVGDQEVIPLEKLKKFGDLKILSLKDLFIE